MDREKLAEAIAVAIYAGTIEIHQTPRDKARKWKTDAPWDSQPEVELCEWERDEYRTMAEYVIKSLEKMDVFR